MICEHCPHWTEHVVPGATCPGSIQCPECGAAACTRCVRPSGHPAAMHAERYLTTEAMDLAAGIDYGQARPTDTVVQPALL